MSGGGRGKRRAIDRHHELSRKLRDKVGLDPVALSNGDRPPLRVRLVVRSSVATLTAAGNASARGEVSGGLDWGRDLPH